MKKGYSKILKTSERFKEARLAAGLTQANCLGIPRRTVQNWETGKCLPPAWVQRLVLAELNRLQITAEFKAR